VGNVWMVKNGVLIWGNGQWELGGIRMWGSGKIILSTVVYMWCLCGKPGLIYVLT